MQYFCSSNNEISNSSYTVQLLDGLISYKSKEKYIKGTLEYKVTFGKGDGEIRLYCIADAAYQNYANGASKYKYSFSLYGKDRQKDAEI